MFYTQVVTLIKSYESGCFFSLVLLLCSVGVFLSLRLCHKQNENKYQQIILIRWLECERLTRNLLSLLCVVVVAAAGENKWAFKSLFPPEDTTYHSQKAACSHAAWTDVKYILLFSHDAQNVSFNTKCYFVEPFCEDRMITLSEKFIFKPFEISFSLWDEHTASCRTVWASVRVDRCPEPESEGKSYF